jgi:hypothetical protein
VRVVSGKFEKGMKVKVARSGRVVTLARPSQMFAQSRATVQEGFAGGCCRGCYTWLGGLPGWGWRTGWGYLIKRGCIHFTQQVLHCEK